MVGEQYFTIVGQQDKESGELGQHMVNGDLYSRYVGCDNLGVADNKEHISYGDELELEWTEQIRTFF